MLKISIFNFKGGTGKSTTALNLGASLASKLNKICLIDLDGQRTLSFGLGLDGDEPTALHGLQENGIKPHSTKIEHLSLIPGDIGMFRLVAEKDIFPLSLNGLIGYKVCLMEGFVL